MSRFVPFDQRHGPAVEFVPEYTPTFTLDSEIVRARREMGPARWAELCAEMERQS